MFGLEELTVKKGVIVIVIGSPEEQLTSGVVTQKTCSHNAKVRMAGLKDVYECTNCHKFIPMIKPKEIDHTAPQYLENSWEDD